MKFAVAIWCLSLALTSCDDENIPQSLLGGGQGGSTDIVSSADGNAQVALGEGFQTMSSEFGAVDDPSGAATNGAVIGNGDPGTSGDWHTGAGGQNIGSMDSTGVSLPASTEVALYGSTSNAMGQPVQVIDNQTGESVQTTIVDIGPGHAAVSRGIGIDITYRTARELNIPVNGSNSVEVIPLKSSNFK